MNERIKLPDQEWLGYDPEKGDMHGYTFEQMREFGEQIVQECIRYFNEDYQRDFDTLWREDLTKGIKEHFGVNT
jgi:hypothetical protein